MTSSQLKEIDKLIAEHVTKIREVLAKPDGPTYLYRIGAHLYETPPHYSTSIDSAWEVVERMRDLCCCLTIIRHPICEPIECEMIPESAEHKEFIGRADTAPLAICLAALKVRGIEADK